MDYFEALKQLRDVALPVQAVAAPGLISPRGVQAAAQTTESFLEQSKNWLKDIRDKADAVAKRNEKTSRNIDQRAEQSAVIVQPRKIPPKLENYGPDVPQEAIQENLIARRGRPSAHAPSADVRDWVGILDKVEGGGEYDTLFGFSQKGGRAFGGVDVSSMTIDELAEFAKPSGEYGQWVKGQVGRVATPMGRYQFVGTTLQEKAKEMGISGDTVFSPEVQDAMFKHYLEQTLSRSNTISGKLSALRGAWEGFKNVDDDTLISLINAPKE